MKIIISHTQFKLLSNDFYIIEGKGIQSNVKNFILESGMREYKVSMWVASFMTQVRIGTHGGSGTAMAIARKLFPKARIYSAKSA